MFEAELQRAVDELSRLDAQMVCKTIDEDKEAESINLQSISKYKYPDFTKAYMDFIS